MTPQGPAAPPLEHLTGEQRQRREAKGKKARAQAAAEFGDDEKAGQRRAPRATRSRRRKRRSPPRAAPGLAGMASARADRKARRATRKAKDHWMARERRRLRPTPPPDADRAEAPTPRHLGKEKSPWNSPAPSAVSRKRLASAPCRSRRTLMGMGVMLTINSQIDDEYRRDAGRRIGRGPGIQAARIAGRLADRPNCERREDDPDGPASRGRRSSPSWATSTMARRRCWTT